jgi:hypothetical protein
MVGVVVVVGGNGGGGGHGCNFRGGGVVVLVVIFITSIMISLIIIIIIIPYNRNTVHVELKNKCDTSNNRANRNHSKIIQKIPEQPTGNPRGQGATENSHIGHCTHTPESTNVKVQ